MNAILSQSVIRAKMLVFRQSKMNYSITFFKKK